MASYANSHFLQAFGISLGAGLSTGLGAALIFLTSSLNRSLLAGTLAFSAGVMVYVSLVEVIGVSTEYFRKGFSEPLSFALATGSFFGGVAIMAVVDRIVHAVFTAVSSGHRTSDLSHLGDDPAGGNGEAGATGCSDSEEEGAAIETVGRITERRRLLAMSAVVSAAIVLHNIPEGMATYVASFHSVGSGLPLAAAIAVHNIPEGLAVAMPVYHATHSRLKALALGTLSGLSEPFGALLASLVANERSSTGAFGAMFGVTAGMMTFVCISELLPSAFAEKGVPRSTVVASFFAGCLVMASSLVIEKFATA